MAADGWVYAIQRMDLLIISISGAGIWVVLETLKYAYDKKLSDLILLKVAGIIFVLAVITNFVSQWTGRNANFHHITMCDEKIIAGDSEEETLLKKIDDINKKASIWDAFTDVFNIISLILMLLGLGTVMIYFLFTF